jgi:membrane-associated phospholipid phosphatase
MPSRLATAAIVIPGWLRSNRMRLLGLFAGVLLPLFLFGELADEVRDQDALAFDEALLRFMQHQATPALDRLMLLASTLGSGLWVTPIDVLVCAVLLFRRRWIDALFWTLATGGASLINMLAKHSYGRIRPDLWPSLAPETSFSFPSGHAMQSMALAAGLIVLLWPTAARWWVVLLGATFTLLVGTSRVYLGVHFPSDVLAGWAASLAWTVGLSFLFYRHAVRFGPRARPQGRAADPG